MDTKIYCKVGNLKITEEEAFSVYESGKYIATYTAVYQPHYSQAQQTVYFTAILTVKGIAPRGKFYILTAEEINKYIGKDILL